MLHRRLLVPKVSMKIVSLVNIVIYDNLKFAIVLPERNP